MVGGVILISRLSFGHHGYHRYYAEQYDFLCDHDCGCGLVDARLSMYICVRMLITVLLWIG